MTSKIKENLQQNLDKNSKNSWRRSALDILNDALLGILGLLCNSTQAAIAKPASLKLKKRCLFLSSCTKSIDFFLAFCIGLRVVNISPNGVSQPKKLKQERYKFHSNQNCLAQKNLTLSRQDHYGIPLVIGYKRKLMCLPYERVIFGLTGSITNVLQYYRMCWLLKKFIHPESCPRSPFFWVSPPYCY